MAMLQHIMLDRIKKDIRPNYMKILKRLADYADDRGFIKTPMREIVANLPGAKTSNYLAISRIQQLGYLESRPQKVRGTEATVFYRMKFPDSGLTTPKRIKEWVIIKNKILWDGLVEIEKITEANPELLQKSYPELMLEISVIVRKTIKRATYNKQNLAEIAI